MIAGYCGKSDEFSDAFYSFARAHVMQGDWDYETFKKAVMRGKAKATNN